MLWTTRSVTEQGLVEELDAARRLLALGAEPVGDNGPDRLYECILETALVLVQADAACLQVYDPARNELALVAHRGMPVDAARIWERQVAPDAIIRVIVPDLAHASLDVRDRAKLERCGVHAWQTVPLVSRKGELLGALTTHWSCPHLPDAREHGYVDLLERHVADVLERARNEEALRRACWRDAFRVALTDALRVLGEPVELQAAAARLLGEYLGASRAYYAELELDHERCTIGETYCRPGVASVAGTYQCTGLADALATSFRPGATLVIEGHQRIPGVSPHLIDWLVPVGRGACIAVPLVRGGVPVATLVVQQLEARTWTRDEIALVEETADRTWSAIERARVQAEVVANEERLRLAIDAADLGTWMVDFARRVTVYDASLTRMLGLGDGGAVRPFGERMALLHPDDVKLHDAAWQAALEHGTYCVEYRITDAAGRLRWAAARGKLVRDADGKPKQMFGVTLDITERKQREEALQEKDQRKDQFLATLAHELRNPLAPILTGLEVIRICDNRDMRERMRNIIEEQSKQLVRLVDDLLDVGRITTGKLQLDKTELDLATIVHTAVATTAPAFEAARHELVVDLPEAPIIVEVDRTRLAQVLTNLLTNAARYTPTGGLVTLTAHVEDEEAVITVTDNGVGIAPEMLERVFDMFVQGSRGEGLGIGLSLVKSLVELHGGSVCARSEGQGRGSVFEVRLPITQPHEAHLIGSGEGATSTRCSVLIADDNSEVLNTHALLLRLMGHEVYTASDGLAALDLAEQFRPDVILMDLGMPNLDGFDAARALRRTPWGAHVRLIAISGWGQERDRRRAQEAGFDAHVIKPVDAAMLRELVRVERRHDAPRRTPRSISVPPS